MWGLGILFAWVLFLPHKIVTGPLIIMAWTGRILLNLLKNNKINYSMKLRLQSHWKSFMLFNFVTNYYFRTFEAPVILSNFYDFWWGSIKIYALTSLFRDKIRGSKFACCSVEDHASLYLQIGRFWRIRKFLSVLLTA